MLFSYQNINTEGTNMRLVNACAPRWTLSFISANDKLYHELKVKYAYKACAFGFLLAEIRTHKPCWCLDC